MSSPLSDKTALVAGGGRGIGRAVALAFAREGARVAVAARSTAEIERVAQECRALGGEALAVRLDVSDAATCHAAAERCLQEWQRIDILVHSAGILSSQRFTSLDPDAWNRTLAVDLSGVFYLTRSVLPAMLERGEGRVIAISSIAGKIGAAYLAPYVAAKHGVIGLMRALAAEYPKSGITFNSVCPAYVETGMTEQMVETIMAKTGRSREETLQAIATPQGRLIQPEEVAAVCLLLAGPEGRSINGQAINIDGGQVMQ